MLQISIVEKGGASRTETFEKAEVTIGRIQGNDVILPKGNISKRHSRVVLKDGKFVVVDLKSTNGTYVNGKRISAPQVVRDSDKIYIGDFTLQIASPEAEAEPPIVPDAFSAAPDAPTGAIEQQVDSAALLDEQLDREFGAPSPGARADSMRSQPAAAAADEQGTREIEDSEMHPPAPPVEPPLAPAEAASGEAPAEAAVPVPSFEAPAPTAPPPVAAASEYPTPAPEVPKEVVPKRSSSSSSRPRRVSSSVSSSGPLAMAPALALAAEAELAGVDLGELLGRAHQQIVEALALSGRTLAESIAMREQVATHARAHLASVLPESWHDQLDALTDRVVRRATGFEKLLSLVEDEVVEEILISHDGAVWAEREGRLEPADMQFPDRESVVDLIHGLVRLGGYDPLATNAVDVRLSDGARVTASLPPLAFRGPSLSYRKATREAFTIDRLVEYQTISGPMGQFLELCVQYQRSMVLVLGPGTSASATLNALMAKMLPDERVVTIENGIELHTGALRNVTALAGDAGESMAELVAHAMRLQPDRVLIGDVRGRDLPEVVRAFSGLLSGSICAYGAESPEEAVDHMVHSELASECASLDAARRLVASAFHVVLQEARLPDQSRRIVEVSEVGLGDDGALVLTPVFRFLPEGVDEAGMTVGRFVATGHVPRFVRALSERGDPVDLEIFQA